MHLRLASLFSLIAVAALPLAVQAQAQRIRARINGNEQKCTFEVRVDGVADVEIHGDTGVLRTVGGSPAQWVRLDCGAYLPNNPGDFRFRGVDGRGRQTLIRDPRSSGGVAVIRLEDPQGGSENYTGEITWSGGNSNWGGGGNWSSGGSGWEDSWSSQSGIDYKEAVRVCRYQVSRVRGVEANSVSVQRNSQGGSGDYDLAFTFRNRWNNTESGRCLVSRSGRLVDFKITGGGFDERISPNQALTVCEQEVQQRLNVGEQDVRVQHGADPGNGSYQINWQARRNGQVRSGQCLVSPSGRISDFRKW